MSASAEKSKTRQLWLWTCAVGCGTLILAGAAVTLGGYVLVVRKVGDAREQALTRFDTNFAACQQAGKLSGDQEAIFSELLEMSKDEQTSFMAAVIADYLLRESVTAAADSERKISMATAVELRDLLRQNPKAGVSELSSFITHHPELKAHFAPEEPAKPKEKDPPLPWQKVSVSGDQSD